MTSRPSIERMAWLSTQLRAGAYVNPFVFAAHFECATKTFYRDCDFMRDRLGFEIEYDRSTKSWALKNDPHAVLLLLKYHPKAVLL